MQVTKVIGIQPASLEPVPARRPSMVGRAGRAVTSGRWSIAGQLFVLQALVVTLLVGAGTAATIALARSDARDAARQEVLAVAQVVARAPEVRAEDGTIIGLVSVGIATRAVNRRLLAQAPTIAAATIAALILAGLGAWLLSRRLRRQTHGLGPMQMTRMYEYYDAVLHSVREGLVVVDQDRRIALINDEGRRLLGLDDGEPVVDRWATDLDVPDGIRELLASGREAHDDPVLAGDRLVVANQRLTIFGGRRLGTVLTLRDHTELRALTGELDSVRGLTDALRAQAHEAANRLHTVLTLVELGRPDEAVRLATAELAHAQQLTDQVVGAVTEPALAALLLGKAAQAAERGIELVVDPESRLDIGPIASRDLITVVGNLIDNAFEAVAPTAPPRRVSVLVRSADDEVFVQVGDSGPGISDEQATTVFERGWSTKQAGRGFGLALVRQVVTRYGGAVAVAHGPEGGALFTVQLPVLQGVRQ